MKRYLLVVVLAFTVILSGCDLIGDYVDIDDLPDEIITETGVFEVGTTEPDWDLVMTALATLEGDTGGTIEFDSSIVDMDTVGVYVVEYSYTDSDDVVTEGSVTITIEDTTVPVITLQGSDNISIEVGTEFIDEGVTILDNYDLGLSIVVSGSVDVDTLGEYTLSYDVTDSNGNVALTVTRTVSVVDPAVPIITLNGEGSITLEVHSEFTDDGVLITDDVDVDMVPVITGVVDTTNIGEYILTYDYTDSDLNVAISVSRVVTIVDTTIPVITITGDSEITIEVGTDYIDEGALVIDNYDTGVTVVVTSDVDGLVLGQYTVAYNFTDSSLNQAVTEERIVNIVDTTIPVITLIGDETIYLECGVDYVEQGVTIVDNYDAGLVAVVTGEVDTEVLGEVTLTYDVTDSNGNVADTVTRTVIVEDTIAPVITLIGEVDFTLE